MDQCGGQPDEATVLVNRGRLYGRDLVLAKALADDFESTGEGGITQRFSVLRWRLGEERPDQRLLRVGELDLRLGQSRGNRSDALTGSLHGRPPRSREHRS